MGNIRSKDDGDDESEHATYGSVASHYEAHNDALCHTNVDMGENNSTCNGSMDGQSETFDICDEPPVGGQLGPFILSKDTMGSNDSIYKGREGEEGFNTPADLGISVDSDPIQGKHSDTALAMNSGFTAIKSLEKTGDESQMIVIAPVQIHTATFEYPQWHVATYCNDVPSEKRPIVIGNRHSFVDQEVVCNDKVAGRIKEENVKSGQAAEIGEYSERRGGMVGCYDIPKCFRTDAILSIDGVSCFDKELNLEQNRSGNGNQVGWYKSVTSSKWHVTNGTHDDHSFFKSYPNCKHSNGVHGIVGPGKWPIIDQEGIQPGEVRGKKRQRGAEELTNASMEIDIEGPPGLEKRLKVSHIFGGGDTITCPRDMNNPSSNEPRRGSGACLEKTGSVHHPQCGYNRLPILCSDDRSLLISNKTGRLPPVKVLSKKKKGNEARRRWMLNRLRERTVVGLSEWMERL